ncbi:MAG: histidine phosphatase family protein [Actinomycetaceae bacterium]|nr:histidine phosphatase family protein [Actinomycetaceae bacterium]
MAPKKIVLWRHGQTDYNLQGKVQGQVQTSLNDTGFAQAKNAAVILQGFQPVKVVTSDLPRAKETADELSALVGVETILDERFRERAFGCFEGLTAQQMRKEYQDYFDQWRRTGECEDAGIELRTAVGRRVRDAIVEYAEQMSDGQSIVITSHGSSITQGIVTLLGLDPFEWQGIRGLDNCHWAVMIPHDKAPGWRLAGHNLGIDSYGFGPTLKRALNQ